MNIVRIVKHAYYRVTFGFRRNYRRHAFLPFLSTSHHEGTTEPRAIDDC